LIIIFSHVLFFVSMNLLCCELNVPNVALVFLAVAQLLVVCDASWQEISPLFMVLFSFVSLQYSSYKLCSVGTGLVDLNSFLI